jgi:hypothetical protein
MGASAWAQDAPAASPDQSGGQAAQQPESSYGGPSLLSRGGAPSVLSRGDLAQLTPYVGVTGTYTSDLNASGVDQQGNPVYQGAYGLSGMFGVTGAHIWPHSVLEVGYNGYYRDYSGYSQYRGFDHSLNLSFEHQLSSRLTLVLTENFSRVRSQYSLPLGSLYGGAMEGYNPLYSALTANSLSDTPTLASVSGVRAVYQATARWSVSASGTGIIARQHLTDTLGTNGWLAEGNVAYRLSRYQTISFDYSFAHFDYEGQFGQTDMHSGGMSYSLRLGRYWELAASGGLSRVESLRAVAVSLDPVLAELLGFTTVFAKENDVFNMPYGMANLTRTFRHANWSAHYSRSVVAGNTLYGTSNYENAASNFSYTGLRRLSLDVGGAYYRYSALTQSLGRYVGFGASGGFGIPIAKGFSSIGRLDWRKYSVSGSSLDRNGYVATFGFSWNPGSAPLALW